MRRKNFTRCASLFLLAVALIVIPSSLQANVRAKTPLTPVAAAFALQPNISLNGFFSADKAQRGRTIQAAVVMEIPRGFHVNANRPGKYVKPTTLRVEARGVKIGPVNYPRGIVKSFSFSQEKITVYENRVVMRFNVSIPANYESGVTELRVRLDYQSCSDDVCFQPEKREISMPIGIVGASDSVKRINGHIFGGGGRRR
jgi:thiol:disulfide interchange protein